MDNWKPISDEALRELVADVWRNLKCSLAASGDEAKRLVMVGENDIAAAVSVAFAASPFSRLAAVEEENALMRTAWRMDAAARLEHYIGLRKSGLIGEPTQVDVTLIMPTLGMLDADTAREYLDPCQICGEPIPFGAPVGAIDLDGDGSSSKDICAKCAPESAAVYTKDGIDVDRAIEKARAILDGEQT